MSSRKKSEEIGRTVGETGFEYFNMRVSCEIMDRFIRGENSKSETYVLSLLLFSVFINVPCAIYLTNYV